MKVGRSFVERVAEDVCYCHALAASCVGRNAESSCDVADSAADASEMVDLAAAARPTTTTEWEKWHDGYQPEEGWVTSESTKETGPTRLHHRTTVGELAIELSELAVVAGPRSSAWSPAHLEAF